ncbi:MAG: substrate-binding domain-containing protein, partial [Spirochaetota bacterium]
PILDGLQAPNEDLYLELLQRGVAIVFVSSAVPGIPASSILSADFQSGRKGAEIMLAKGFRDFILFYQKNYLTKAIRIDGAKDVLNKQKNVTYRELAFVDQRQHSDTQKKCIEFFGNLPKSTEPMGWLCSSDEDAAIVIEVARTYGWELHCDYELIGFDNSQLSELVGGGFSSFTVPGKLIGRMAARYLLDQLTELPNERHCTDILIHSNFIQRNFCDFAMLQARKEPGG